MIETLIQKRFLDDLKNIYKMINGILYEYEVSKMFSCFPNTDMDCGNSYETRLESIREYIDCTFWHCQEARTSLHKIVDDIMYIISNGYEIPSVPERWFEANPHLRYFDCVYNMIEDDFDSYKDIKDNKMCFEFSFIPTLDEYMERKNYFEEKRRKYSDCNIDVTEARLYQDELIDTFAILFEKEISKYLTD